MTQIFNALKGLDHSLFITEKVLVSPLYFKWTFKRVCASDGPYSFFFLFFFRCSGITCRGHSAHAFLHQERSFTLQDSFSYRRSSIAIK